MRFTLPATAGCEAWLARSTMTVFAELVLLKSSQSAPPLPVTVVVPKARSPSNQKVSAAEPPMKVSFPAVPINVTGRE